MPNRIFKAKAFAAGAKKASISDGELVEAIDEVIKGQADNLGGGVWKKRLNENRHRSIILAKGRGYWVYQFLYAKKDQSTITSSELTGFKKLAKLYDGLSEAQVQMLVDRREFVEIGHGEKIQK